MGIELMHLTRQFGAKIAVRDLTLSIGGGMHGLLGPNGAGKTTLMRMLCTLLAPTAGEAALDGIPLTSKREIRRIVGYLPQDFSFYPGFTVQETLDYLGLLSEMKDSAARRRRIGDMLELTNLTGQRKTKVRQLSGGMRRRLGIAQVLLHDPSIVVVDEPTAGLDPEERIRFRNLLVTLSGGKTVLFSTHIAEDILQTCPNVAILHEGSLRYAGSVRALTQRAQGKVWHAQMDMAALDALQARYTVVSTVLQPEGCQVRLLADEQPCAGAQPAEPGLEDAYMLLVKGGGADASAHV